MRTNQAILIIGQALPKLSLIISHLLPLCPPLFTVKTGKDQDREHEDQDEDPERTNE